MILLNPPFRNLKNAKIEPLIIQKEKLDELKAVMANPKLPNVHKHMVMRTISGHCHSCSERIPTKKISYDVGNATVIEKYCDECLARINTK